MKVRDFSRLVRFMYSADRLPGIAERRIVTINFDLSQQRANPGAFRMRIGKLLFDQIADHADAFGPEYVEWVRRDIGVGGGLEREQTDLGSVAMRYEDLMVKGEIGERKRCLAHIGALDIGGHRFTALEKGIAAERHDDSHLRLPAWRRAQP